MKVDTKYSKSIMSRLNSTTAGALANILDRMLYDAYNQDGYIKMRLEVWVGKDGKPEWVAPTENKAEGYADGLKALTAIRDELYALALASTLGERPL